jgi:hypothetical protein
MTTAFLCAPPPGYNRPPMCLAFARWSIADHGMEEKVEQALPGGRLRGDFSSNQIASRENPLPPRQ